MPDSGPQVAISSDDRSLHLQHGPIDLLIECDGTPAAVTKAHDSAIACFGGLLEELVDELELLRSYVGLATAAPNGSVGRRMYEAVQPFAELERVTPMAAVAGSVADAVGTAMEEAAELERWQVNNGGDIALGLRARQSYRVGLVADPRRGLIESHVLIEAGAGVGGVATSGRHGRSLSLGIADAVTVFASSAAAADAAATLIANRVDIGSHPQVARQPARTIDPDSDLGDTPVTVEVGVLSSDDVREALDNGLVFARECVDRGLVKGVVLSLAGAQMSVASEQFSLSASAVEQFDAVP